MTFAQEWAEQNPRPEWDDPEHWAKSRPVFEEKPKIEEDENAQV